MWLIIRNFESGQFLLTTINCYRMWIFFISQSKVTIWNREIFVNEVNLRLPLKLNFGKHISLFFPFILIIKLKHKSKSIYPSNNENFPWVNDNSQFIHCME